MSFDASLISLLTAAAYGGPNFWARLLPFDPEGKGYDYATATKYGLERDPDSGHFQSREPMTGQILKGKGHETFHLTEQGEKEAGYEIYKGPDGKYYSRKIKKGG